MLTRVLDLYASGKYAEAHTMGELLLKTGKLDASVMSRLRNWIALSYYADGNIPAALLHAKINVRSFRDSGAKGEADARTVLAFLLGMMGEHNRAAREADAAIAIYKGCGPQLILRSSNALLLRGNADCLQHRYDAGLRWYIEAERALDSDFRR